MFPRATPPGEDGVQKSQSEADLFKAAVEVSIPDQGEPEGDEPDYLNLMTQAITQGQTFVTQSTRSAWDRSIKSYYNEHFQGSKYKSKDWRNRSSLFRPKIRSAVRKDLAAAASSLFSTVDAISCEPGDESSPQQRASAAILKELLNYRTDRTGGRNSIPWFRVAMGARFNALLMSVCVSKQSWKLVERTRMVEQPIFDIDPATNTPVLDPMTGEPVTVLDEFGEPATELVPTIETIVDRPDIQLIPIENIIVDPAADWLDPVQTGSFWIVKYPMRKFEIEAMQRDPRRPWKKVDWSRLRADRTKQDSAGVRQVREGGQDRFDATRTGTGDFEVFWVSEVFMRINEEDVQFWADSDGRAYLTDPVPVEEVYPEFAGERPYTWGVATLEAHRLFPMGPVESWQPLQQEINDLANLRLDQVKLNVSPLAMVKRGRNVDLQALQRRGPNSIILRTEKDDIEWDRPPEVPSSAYAEMERLNSDFDDLAGQFNSSSVQTNRSMNETVGGMKLIAGNANVVGEFDLRTWIETWVEPTLGQVVKLEQYYESDERILALCGERAKLFQKFGIDQITDELLQEQVSVRVNVGIGNGSPQERLQKFAGAVAVLTPMFQNNPKVQSGEIEVDLDEVSQEVFGLTGYRDGGKRFIKKGEPKPNPAQEAEAAKIQAETQDKQAAAELKTAQAEKARTDAKVSMAQLIHGAMMDRANLVQGARTEQNRAQAQQREGEANRAARKEEMTLRQQQTANNEAAGTKAIEQSAPEAEGMPAEDPAQQQIQQLAQIIDRKRVREVQFIKGPDGRISGARIIDQPEQGQG